jgi:hypothetical protein
MVDLGRRVVDDIKEFQEKTLAVMNPLAGKSCLNKGKHRFQQMIHIQLTSVYHCLMSLRA